MAMRFNDKADIIAGLRKAIGDDRPLFGKESPDGKYIPARIAFEENSPEEKERLKISIFFLISIYAQKESNFTVENRTFSYGFF